MKTLTPKSKSNKIRMNISSKKTINQSITGQIQRQTNRIHKKNNENAIHTYLQLAIGRERAKERDYDM